MDTDTPSSENRPVSSLCILKRKLNHSRRVHTQNTSESKPLTNQHCDQKERLTDLAMKIRDAHKSPERKERPFKRNSAVNTGKVVHLRVIK